MGPVNSAWDPLEKAEMRFKKKKNTDADADAIISIQMST